MKVNAIKHMRIENGMSQGRMAKEIGMALSNYRKKEWGETRFSVDELMRIGLVLGLSMEDMNFILFDDAFSSSGKSEELKSWSENKE